MLALRLLTGRNLVSKSLRAQRIWIPCTRLTSTPLPLLFKSLYLGGGRPFSNSSIKSLGENSIAESQPSPQSRINSPSTQDAAAAAAAAPTAAAASLSTSDATLLSKLPIGQHSHDDTPSYAMVFTCKKCNERSAHKISKQGYHHGTVMITCPGCKNKHLISDHLKIFADQSVTMEDILAKKGDALKKLAINENGDLEFWSDQPAPVDRTQQSSTPPG